MAEGGRPKVVVLGLMSKIPVAGVIWQTLHYLLGFERLGMEVHYVEAHARTPSMLMRTADDDSSLLAANLIGNVLAPYGLGERWAFQALHDDARCYGMPGTALRALYRDAALIINLHGGTLPLPEHVATDRLVYLETDPVQPQIELFEGIPETIDFLDQHCAHFSFAENYGQATCTLPVTKRYEFHPTRQPVVLDWWQCGPPPPDGRFTTIANWSQPWRNVSYQGRVFGWSKNDEFRRVIDLPAMTTASLELALANCDADDRAKMVERGWEVRPARGLSESPSAYREYIQASRGEFTVAKEQNVAFRTGWFSDRSATYLAAGRPVITQDTGFGEALPTGNGLVAFTTPEEAAAALADVQADYQRHAEGAAEVARSHFSHEVVLGSMLDILGVSRGGGCRTGSRQTLPDSLVVVPVSKRPIRLAPDTLDTLTRRRRAGVWVPSHPVRPGPVEVSVIIPVHGRVDLTQMCVESMLSEPHALAFEVVVVDDASTDETPTYLAALGRAHPQVRVVTNEDRRGFARSVNHGIATSRGRVLIVANNDTVTGPGWMAALVAHLDDRSVGLAAASTAGHSRNCRVDGDYATYGQLRSLAAERVADRKHPRPVSMAPLFFAAFRREVVEQIGPLDEGFDVGMFEDDDYCARLRQAGYSVVCALDVFVHHYGEGTLGEMFADGTYHAVFEANRGRFEQKWDQVWIPDEDHASPAYEAQVEDVRSMLAAAVPAGDLVAIASRGDDKLIALDGPEGCHLPRTATGAYLGAHPSDSSDAIAQIDSVRAEGARWLFLPHWSSWWLSHYESLEGHLGVVGQLVRHDDLGDLYLLEPTPEPRRSGVDTPADHSASACTIISRNYLGQARVLAESFLRHHPNARFYLLVIDGLPPGTPLDSRICLVDPTDLPLHDFHDMAFKYDVVELATAVKPALLLLLTEGRGEQRTMYIDPDILITRPMTEVFDALDTADVVLTPHLNAPIPLDGHAPREQDILISGAYNLGFIAVRRSPETIRLLEWWRERLDHLCRVDPANGLMVDQRWIDLVPSLFPTACILRDDTYNVAYWNLHARDIERADHGYTCNGRPLAMFHFSGYNPERPGVISKHQTRTDLIDGSALRELFDAYGEAMLGAGFLESKAWGYGLNAFDNGIGVHAIFRRLYHELGDDRRRFGNPLETAGGDSFYVWATAPDPARRNLSPFLEMAYRLRYDVQAAFPDVAGSDREGFLAWAMGQGAAEFGFEPEVVRPCGGVPTPASDVSRGVDAAIGVSGVNVCGYLRNESGLGAAARAYIGILEHLGVPLALRDVSNLSVNRSEDTSINTFHADHGHPVNLVCVNADQHFVVMAQDPSFFEGRYNIGVWFWELPSFPEEWRDRFAHYDEIWVGSSYIANTLAPLSPVPVVRVPPVLGTQRPAHRQAGRDRIGAADDEFVFLFMFDFNSYIERKNPTGVIEAFRMAFDGCERARLVIKSVNGASDSAGLAVLQAAAGGDERVTLFSEYVTSAEIADLTQACDCYVSLHRAEGTGLTMAHAMAAGKPVIATGWSGNTDFMDASNSLLVRFDLVELDRDVGPYKIGGIWADPDVEHAAALMRHVFTNPEEAAALGAAARSSIATRFSAESIGQTAAERLRVIGEQLGRAGHPLPPVAPKHGGNAALMGAIRRIVAREIGDRRPVVVVSKGDPVLVDLGEQPAWHYPQDDDGVYAGYYPADSATAIAHLERLRERGAGYFLVPATCGWWLQHYEELRQHLDSHYQRAAEDASCVLYRLDPVAVPVAAVDAGRLEDVGAQVQHVRETLEATGEWLTDLAPRIVATQERVEAIPDVLRDALTTISASVVDIEGDLQGRVDVVQRGQERLAGIVASTEAKLDAFALHVEASRRQAAAVVDRRTEDFDRRAAELAQRVEALRPAPASPPPLRSLGPAPAGRPAELTTGSAGRHDVAVAVDHRFRARPYMSDDRFSTGDLDQPMGFSRTDGREDQRLARPTFADVFRGAPSLVADRQRDYLPLFPPGGSVVDLGSGRGEFLDLMAGAGLVGEGVEADGSLVRACRRRGRSVRHQDAFDYLNEAEPASVDGVFSAQLIEHLEPRRLHEFAVHSRRVLRRGGTFIAETVNPENYEALKTFHVDLTHQRPIFPQVLLHLCWEAGFDAAWIFYPLGGGFTQRCYDAVGEYAVVARA